MKSMKARTAELLSSYQTLKQESMRFYNVSNHEVVVKVAD